MRYKLFLLRETLYSSVTICILLMFCTQMWDTAYWLLHNTSIQYISHCVYTTFLKCRIDMNVRRKQTKYPSMYYRGLDVIGILKSLGLGSSFLDSKLASGAGSFAVAYVAYKIFFPLRFGVTLTVTPVLVRYLRRKGIIKPPKVKAAGAKDTAAAGKAIKTE